MKDIHQFIIDKNYIGISPETYPLQQLDYFLEANDLTDDDINEELLDIYVNKINNSKYFHQQGISRYQFLIDRFSSNNTLDVTDNIISKYKGILYHITTLEKCQRIQRRGLQPSKGNYREYPERIYLFATDDENEIEQVKKMKSDTFGNSDTVVLKINLYAMNRKNPYRIALMRDDLMKRDNYVYTYDYINPKFIERIQ